MKSSDFWTAVSPLEAHQEEKATGAASHVALELLLAPDERHNEVQQTSK